MVCINHRSAFRMWPGRQDPNSRKPDSCDGVFGWCSHELDFECYLKNNVGPRRLLRQVIGVNTRMPAMLPQLCPFSLWACLFQPHVHAGGGGRFMSGALRWRSQVVNRSVPLNTTTSLLQSWPGIPLLSSPITLGPAGTPVKAGCPPQDALSQLSSYLVKMEQTDSSLPRGMWSLLTNPCINTV